MELTQDKLVVCPCCGSDACYESEFTTQDGPVNTWLCMTCGFTTNSTMTEDSEALKQTLEYTDWGWTVVKAISIPEEDQEKYPDPRNPGVNYKFKMDMEGKKRFLKLEFMDAAEELGMFTKQAVRVPNKNKNED